MVFSDKGERWLNKNYTDVNVKTIPHNCEKDLLGYKHPFHEKDQTKRYDRLGTVLVFRALDSYH